MIKDLQYIKQLVPFEVTKTFSSQILKSVPDIKWLIDQLPQCPRSFNLLFSSNTHGWKCRDWAKSVLGKPNTITIMRTTKSKVCGGYLNIPWKEEGGYTDDKRAFIFSIDNRLKFTPSNGHDAVCFDLKDGWGPWFSRSLAVGNQEMMNAPDNCCCNTNGKNRDHYKVTNDPLSNSILTGDGAWKEEKRFTLNGIETW